MENSLDSSAINFSNILIEKNFIEAIEPLIIKNIQSSAIHEDNAFDKTSIEAKNCEITNSLSILQYLSSIKEFELYYYLFNQISVINVGDNKIEIARDGAEKNLNTRLAEILFAWTGNKWNVIIADSSNIPNLKEQMKLKFMQSEEWKMLQELNCDIVLTDIILG